MQRLYLFRVSSTKWIEVYRRHEKTVWSILYIQALSRDAPRIIEVTAHTVDTWAALRFEVAPDCSIRA
jgi:hypothetical protein